MCLLHYPTNQYPNTQQITNSLVFEPEYSTIPYQNTKQVCLFGLVYIPTTHFHGVYINIIPLSPSWSCNW
jgi:hypothetical protein